MFNAVWEADIVSARRLEMLVHEASRPANCEVTALGKLMYGARAEGREERAAHIAVNKIVTMLFEQGREAMSERVTAWQCIGCGRIEGAQPCLGICEDRRTDFVYAADYDEVLAQLTRARRRTEALAALVRQLAHTTPRKGEWESTYAALQARARRTLEALGNDEQSKPA